MLMAMKFSIFIKMRRTQNKYGDHTVTLTLHIGHVILRMDKENVSLMIMEIKMEILKIVLLYTHHENII